MRLLLTFFSVLALTGCGAFPVFNSTDHTNQFSGKAPGKIGLDVYAPQKPDPEKKTLKGLPSIPDGVLKICNAKSGVEPESLEVVVATLVVEAVEYGIDYLADKRKKALDQLKEAATRTYKASFLIPPGELFATDGRCLVMTRKNEENKTTEPDMVMVIHYHAKAQAGLDEVFVLQPKLIYLHANNAVAFTHIPKEGTNQPPSIDLTTALSIKTTKVEKNVPTLASVGELAFTVPSVPLQKHKDVSMDLDLIPLKATQNDYQVTVSVTETGKVGFDIDKAKTQVDTLKDAIGPVIIEKLKKALPDAEEEKE